MISKDQLQIIENYIDSAIYCIINEEYIACSNDLGKIKGIFIANKKQEPEENSPSSRCF